MLCKQMHQQISFAGILKNQKGIEVIFTKIKNANHFFKGRENELSKKIQEYIKEKTALI